MTGLKSAFAAIHRTNIVPELKFAAALIADAAEAARAGDCDAYAWLEHCSLRWLHAITPDGDDCERIQQALLATIPALECEPDLGVTHFQPSETTADTVQLRLAGLEL